MERLHHRDSFLLASVVGSWGDQRKGVVEMSDVGFLAPQQRAQAGNAVPSPERSHGHLGLTQNSIIDDFTVMPRIFLDFMARGPQQPALAENNFVLTPRVTVAVVHQKDSHVTSPFILGYRLHRQGPARLVRVY